MSNIEKKPSHQYAMGDSAIYKERVQIHGSDYRLIEKDGRKGLHIQGVQGRFVLPYHTVALPKGSATMWVMPLDDIDWVAPKPQYEISNPSYYHHIVFLTDRERLAHVNVAQFAWYYQKSGYPPMFAKFHKGIACAELGYSRLNGAYATGEYFYMRRLHWYQLALTWDKEKGLFRIYANGVLVALEDQYRTESLVSERPGMFLYGGSPSIAFSDIAFYDKALSQEQIRSCYSKETSETIKSANAAVDTDLGNLFEGKNLERFSWKPGAGWKQQLALGLNRTEDMLSFYHQGDIMGMQVTKEGLRITTPSMETFYQLHGKWSECREPTRMYIFTRKTFEGDLYVTGEFKLLKHGGLCLLMAQVQGMLGEDFMDDYPLRSEGGMSMVHCEDVRNYHWEFYREVPNNRADLCSYIFRKNPFGRRKAQVENRKNELGRWYRFHFLQEGDLVRCAVDDTQVLSFKDDGFLNSGPVSRSGHVGLRCMMQTDVVFRNLEIHTKADFKTITNT